MKSCLSLENLRLTTEAQDTGLKHKIKNNNNSKCLFDSQQPYDIGSTIIPILQMGKLRPREVKSLAQDSIQTRSEPSKCRERVSVLKPYAILSSVPDLGAKTRTSYIFCQAQCKMKMWGPLFKRQEKSFFLSSAVSFQTDHCLSKSAT